MSFTLLGFFLFHRHLFLTQAAGLQDEFPKDEMKEVEYREYAGNAHASTL